MTPADALLDTHDNDDAADAAAAAVPYTFVHAQDILPLLLEFCTNPTDATLDRLKAIVRCIALQVDHYSSH